MKESTTKIWILLLFFSFSSLIYFQICSSSISDDNDDENLNNPIIIDQCDDDLNVTSLAFSAFNRAKTNECKLKIKSLACHVRANERTRFFRVDNLKRSSKCKLADKASKAFAKDDFTKCVSELDVEKLLKLNDSNLIEEVSFSLSLSFSSSLEFYNACIDNCLSRMGYKFIILNKTKCFCLKDDSDDALLQVVNNTNIDSTQIDHRGQIKFLADKNECESRILNDNYLKIFSIGIINYSIGMEHFKSNKYVKGFSYTQIKEIFNEIQKKRELPRIVFLLSLNGRSIRQVNRLIKTIYTDYNFYYIHVDGRMKFLKQQLSRVLKGYDNIRIADWSMETIWGGSSLLKMHLRVMHELKQLRDEEKWNWSYLINLSESDFPLKSIDELNIYLGQFDDYNFIKFHSMPIKEFIAKQGLKFAFLECDNHLWRVIERPLPKGLQLGGGSDWFCLHFNFINYVLTTKDKFVLELKHYFKYSILPSETFFHTILLNSPFCDRFIDSNLKLTNWIHSRGCRCQYQHVVDWCGCSPNYFTNQNWRGFAGIKDKPLFFARKFDQLFGGLMINRVDQAMYGLYSTNLKSLYSYWDNIYDKQTDYYEDDDDENENEKKKDFKIPAKYLALFNYFVEKSLHHLKYKLVSMNYVKLNQRIDEKLNELSTTTTITSSAGFKKSFLQLLKQVNSFFDADEFNGLVLNVELTFADFNVNFETLFKPIKHITVNRLSSNPDEEEKERMVEEINKDSDLKRKGQLIQNNLISIELSTDYDSKDRQFRSNYPGVMDGADIPIVKLDFDPMNETIDLFFSWFDPENKKVGKSKITLNKMNDNQLFLVKLIDPSAKDGDELKPGIWKLNLTIEENFNVVNVLTYKYLILKKTQPTTTTTTTRSDEKEKNKINDEKKKKQDAKMIDEFWRLDSICVNELTLNSGEWKQSSLFSEEILPDCKTSANSYWSSYFPDPKSDLSEDLSKSIHKFRVT